MKQHRDEFLRAYIEKVEALKAQIEAMKNCGNCKLSKNAYEHEYRHDACRYCDDFSNWQLKDKDE